MHEEADKRNAKWLHASASFYEDVESYLTAQRAITVWRALSSRRRRALNSCLEHCGQQQQHRPTKSTRCIHFSKYQAAAAPVTNAVSLQRLISRWHSVVHRSVQVAKHAIRPRSLLRKVLSIWAGNRASRRQALHTLVNALSNVVTALSRNCIADWHRSAHFHTGATRFAAWAARHLLHRCITPAFSIWQRWSDSMVNSRLLSQQHETEARLEAVRRASEQLLAQHKAELESWREGCEQEHTLLTNTKARQVEAPTSVGTQRDACSADASSDLVNISGELPYALRQVREATAESTLTELAPGSGRDVQSCLGFERRLIDDFHFGPQDPAIRNSVTPLGGSIELDASPAQTGQDVGRASGSVSKASGVNQVPRRGKGLVAGNAPTQPIASQPLWTNQAKSFRPMQGQIIDNTSSTKQVSAASAARAGVSHVVAADTKPPPSAGETAQAPTLFWQSGQGHELLGASNLPDPASIADETVAPAWQHNADDMEITKTSAPETEPSEREAIAHISKLMSDLRTDIAAEVQRSESSKLSVSDPEIAGIEARIQSCIGRLEASLRVSGDHLRRERATSTPVGTRSTMKRVPGWKKYPSSTDSNSGSSASTHSPGQGISTSTSLLSDSSHVESPGCPDSSTSSGTSPQSMRRSTGGQRSRSSDTAAVLRRNSRDKHLFKQGRFDVEGTSRLGSSLSTSSAQRRPDCTATGSTHLRESQKPLQSLLSELSVGREKAWRDGRPAFASSLQRSNAVLPQQGEHPVSQLSCQPFSTHFSKSKSSHVLAKRDRCTQSDDSSTDSREKTLADGAQARSSSSCSSPAPLRFRREQGGRSITSQVHLSPGFGRAGGSSPGSRCRSLSPSRSPVGSPRMSVRRSGRRLHQTTALATEARPRVQRNIVTWPVAAASRNYSSNGRTAGDSGAVRDVGVSHNAQISQTSLSGTSAAVASPSRSGQRPVWRS